jgi:beta-1,4-mannosyltransferase
MTAKILFFQRSASTYTDCLFAALRQSGVECVDAMFAGRWLVANARRGDIALFHWPSFLYAINASGLKCLVWFARCVALLLLLRIKGARIVWVAHNLMPHDRSRIELLDPIGRWLVIRLSERILVHGANTAKVLQERFPATAGKLVLIPHGNWIDHYKHDITRVQARRALGIPDGAFVHLFFGACKSYKRIDALVSAFRKGPLGDYLVIAGRFQEPAYEKQILALIGGDSRVIMNSGFIEDDDVQTYLRACDAVVVPYREILTSGTAILAMSFGRPIVSIRAGFLIDVVDATTGLLFDAEDPTGLDDALRRIRDMQFDESAILARARGYTFEQAAAILLETMHARPAV